MTLALLSAILLTASLIVGLVVGYRFGRDHNPLIGLAAGLAALGISVLLGAIIYGTALLWSIALG